MTIKEHNEAIIKPLLNSANIRGIKVTSIVGIDALGKLTALVVDDDWLITPFSDGNIIKIDELNGH